MQSKDCTNIEVPVVLRDRIAAHRLHPRQAYYEIIEEAIGWWEESGGWLPCVKAPLDF